MEAERRPVSPREAENALALLVPSASKGLLLQSDAHLGSFSRLPVCSVHDTALGARGDDHRESLPLGFFHLI